MQRQIGRYAVSGELGRGAMGVVYLADDPVLGRQVAIKTLDVGVDDPGEKEFLRGRLLRDARAAAALSHPNIVGVYDVIEEDSTAYLVMEYVAGENLAARLKSRPRPDAAFTLGILRQMASALDYTHARGIIHRDIKPANVMIAAGGVAKIMDFGIARVSDARTSTPTGMVMGTVEYMAPEQIKGEPVDGRADQFSLAAVAYEMATGSTLFGPHTFATLAYKLVTEMPPPARTRNQALPAGVDGVLAKALGKSPAERFGSCGEFVASLEAAFREEPAPPPPAPVPRSGYVGIAAVLGLLALGAGLMVWRPWTPAASRPQPPDGTIVTKTNEAPRAVASETAVAKTQHREPAKSKTVAPVVATKVAPKEAVKQPEPDPELEYVKGDALVQKGDYAEAVPHLNKAITLRPDFVRAYMSRGRAYQDQEQMEAAIEDYTAVIRLRPRDALAYHERGVCLSHLRQDDRALEDYNKALELRPEMPLALNGRGAIYLRRKQYDQAIRNFTEAIRMLPTLALAYENRARARRAKGDEAGARADLEKAQELRARSKSGS